MGVQGHQGREEGALRQEARGAAGLVHAGAHLRRGQCRVEAAAGHPQGLAA